MTNQVHKSQEHKSTSHNCTSKIQSLYIHIPFCKKKCNYCDFVSYAGKEELIDEYVEAMTKEIGYWTQDRKTAGLKTIYFGGGTPTLLSPEHFEQIFAKLDIRNWILEISIETNPGTADLEKLKALRKLGINRISIGCQSFNDKHLQTLGRIHNAKDILKFYEDARTAGFDNINLDLIFALPNQSLDEWKEDLSKAISLGPEHFSTYNLQIEEGTPLWEITKFQLKAPSTKQAPNPKLQIPSNETEAEMYEFAIETLKKAGYIHYEISNFAKPGFECQHNIAYWKNENYIGVGAGAHSHVNGKRWANSDSIEEYLSAGHRMPNNDTGRGTGPDNRETIFMGLRLLDGIGIENFNGFEKEVEELIKDGLLIQENNNYKLTKKGLLLGNLVFEKFV